MLGPAHALARWLLAALGVLALVTSVAMSARGTIADGSDEAGLAPAGSTAGDLDLSPSPEERSEERDEDERDEEDSTDPEVALHLDTLLISGTCAETDRLGAHDRPHVGDDDRAGHARGLERPPHA